jgi:DnaJ-class molecular chaperone
MRSCDYPDPPDSPDDDEPAGKRVKCWQCNGNGLDPIGDYYDEDSRWTKWRCGACNGAGYTHEPETEEETTDES